MKHLLLPLLLTFACRNGATSQPTATPRGATPWAGLSELQPGSVESDCQLGGVAATPARSSWAYAAAKDVCLVHTLTLPKRLSADHALGPIDDCGTISEVGDLTYDERGQRLYLIGSLSVQKRIDEGGSVSFDGGTASLLFQINDKSPDLPNVLDTTETLRNAILEEFQRWAPELEKRGLYIEQDKRALVVGGLAATPEQDFLLALRAPKVCPLDDKTPDRCRAIVLLLSDLDEMFTKKGARPDIKARASLPLGGAGIASLEYEPLSEGFLLTTTSNEASLLRYNGALAAPKLLPVPVSKKDSLRAVVPAPGGAAALSIQEKEGRCRLSWEPIPLESFDGADRSPPPDEEEL